MARNLMKTKRYAGFYIAVLIFSQSRFSWAQAPASFTGLTLDVTITAAGGGDTGSGSYTISFSPSTATVNYQGHVKTSSYTYSLANPGTGKVLATAADGSGNVNTIYFYFADPNDGTYSSTNTSGSYEDGTFAITPPISSAPQLSIKPAPTNTLLFTWIAPTNGYRLQANGSLNTTNWTTLTNAPMTVGTSNQIVLTVPASNVFYRLALP